MTKLHRFRIAAMLAADSHLQPFASLSPFGHSYTHERADTILIDTHKRVRREQALENITGQKFSRVIAGQAEAGLSEIVGAKGKKLRFLGDVIRDHAGPRQLDHCPHEVAHLDAVRSLGLFGNAFDDAPLFVYLLP